MNLDSPQKPIYNDICKYAINHLKKWGHQKGGVKLVEFGPIQMITLGFPEVDKMKGDVLKEINEQ
jgi:hypothetical protein